MVYDASFIDSEWNALRLLKMLLKDASTLTIISTRSGFKEDEGSSLTLNSVSIREEGNRHENTAAQPPLVPVCSVC